MASVTHSHLPPSLRRLFATALSSLRRRLTWPRLGGRLWRSTGPKSARHWQQQHFGSLDDQLLSDLGLQRSEIRAAEYGILPGDQALHHEEDSQRADDEAGRTGPQPRSDA